MQEYKAQVKEDLKTLFEDNEELKNKNVEELRELLQDPSWNESITGNASGSYYCNTYKAQEMINNSGLIWDEEFINALEDFGTNVSDLLREGAEVVDVWAREIALYNLSDEEIEECKTM